MALGPVLAALGQTSVTTHNSDGLAAELARYGLDFAPDPALGEAAPRKGDTITVFPRDQKNR